jgi:small GTP-binding protein
MKRQYVVTSSLINANPKKIVLLGEGSIGKSTFYEKMTNLKNDEYTFQKKYKATDNFDFARLNIDTNEGTVIIDLWDTAGQETRGGILRDAYLKGADGVLLFYDMTEQKTVTHIPKWLDQIKRVAPNVPVAVIGNKADIFDNIQQTDSVKLREVNLRRDVGHNKIKNFLISIKENTHLEFKTSMWSSSITTEEKESCLVGMEYVLDNIFNKSIKIKP